MYTDGGLDHRLTYISTQISLLCLFKKLDLDFLCAARTAPYHSWCNPVERIMSVINLGFQSVGIARAAVDPAIESEIAKCNSLSDLRKISEKRCDIIAGVMDSLSPVKVLLTQIMQRLMLKDKPFQVFTSATPSEIDESTLSYHEKVNKSNIKDYSYINSFIKHYCSCSHYHQVWRFSM